MTYTTSRFPGGTDGKESACNAGNLGSIPGSGRSPREGNGYPLYYSCLENPMDRGAWQALVHRVVQSQMTEQLTLHFTSRWKLYKPMQSSLCSSPLHGSVWDGGCSISLDPWVTPRAEPMLTLGRLAMWAKKQMLVVLTHCITTAIGEKIPPLTEGLKEMISCFSWFCRLATWFWPGLTLTLQSAEGWV